MTIESATYIQDFVSANPSGSDQKKEGDDHIRLIKAVLKATLPTATGPINISTYIKTLLDDADAATARATLDAASITVANPFTAAQTVTLTGVTAEQTLVSTDAGAAEAVALDLYRNSISPLANDLLMSLTWSGNSVTPTKRVIAKALAKLLTTTNGLEDGELRLSTIRAGTVTENLVLGKAGIYTPNATGTDKGADTGNSKGWYKDGSILPLLDVVVSGTTASPGVTDHGKEYIPTGAGFTLTLPALAGLFNGYRVGLQNYCSSGTCLANRSSTDTITSQGTVGLTSITLPSSGDQVWFIADVTNSLWRVRGKRSFESAEITLANSTIDTKAHSLQVVPRQIQLFLRNKTGELGYTAGDEIEIGAVGADRGSAQRNYSLVLDATNGVLLMGTAGTTVGILNKGTPASFVNLTTPGNWKHFWRATVIN